MKKPRFLILLGTACILICGYLVLCLNLEETVKRSDAAISPSLSSPPSLPRIIHFDGPRITDEAYVHEAVENCGMLGISQRITVVVESAYGPLNISLAGRYGYKPDINEQFLYGLEEIAQTTLPNLELFMGTSEMRDGLEIEIVPTQATEVQGETRLHPRCLSADCPPEDSYTICFDKMMIGGLSHGVFFGKCWQHTSDRVSNYNGVTFYKSIHCRL